MSRHQQIYVNWGGALTTSDTWSSPSIALMIASRSILTDADTWDIASETSLQIVTLQVTIPRFG